jgi:hypothetical protein
MASIFPFLYDSNSIQECLAAEAAIGWSCGESVAITDLELTARALAKASAEATSYAYVNCQVSEGGYTCASADSSISVWIQAVARAWAGAWAAGIQCDDKCFVDIDVVVDSVGSVLVDAVTDAYAFVCGGAFLTHLHSTVFPVFSALNAC